MPGFCFGGHCHGGSTDAHFSTVTARLVRVMTVEGPGMAEHATKRVSGYSLSRPNAALSRDNWSAMPLTVTSG